MYSKSSIYAHRKKTARNPCCLFDHIADIAGDCTGSVHVLGKAAGAEKDNLMASAEENTDLPKEAPTQQQKEQEESDKQPDSQDEAAVAAEEKKKKKSRRSRHRKHHRSRLPRLR